MADALGTYGTSYELDAALKLDIEEMVTHISPFDAPFLGTYNGLENAPTPSILPTGTVFEVQYDWLEDELLTPRSQLNGAYTAGGFAFTLDSGEAAKFQPDDLIRVQSTAGDWLQYRISSINYSTDVLTLDSTMWDGTDANIADNTPIEGVGTLPAEGSDPPAARATDRSRVYNYTQIFGPYPVELTETEQVVAKYGVTSEWDHQTVKRVKEATIAQEHAILYGIRKNDTTNKRRSMGGIDYFISAANGSSIDSSTTDLSGATGETALSTLQQNCYNNGGDPRLVVVGPDQKPNISGWDASNIRTSVNERKRGQIVTVFETDFNVVDIVMHRWVRSNNLFLFNPTQAEVSTLVGRGLKWVKTAKTGDRDEAYVICEKGFKFRGAKHAGKMTALT